MARCQKCSSNGIFYPDADNTPTCLNCGWKRYDVVDLDELAKEVLRREGYVLLDRRKGAAGAD
ncbi:hypothetical protein LCGC14_2930240 [marine sediment metagenome]|uniref:Uncharacterized protein n=1 Tax=marine sediment metagenome TaxID=412755 RepID=A0A0F9AC79_9ZZZZ